MKYRAFTLVEMLVLLVVLSVVAALLLPMFGSSTGKMSFERRQCQSNLRHLGLAFRVYASDHDEKFPPLSARYDGWTSLLAPYIRESQVFTCPSTRHQGATDFFYNARLATLERPRVALPGQTITAGDGADVGWPSAYLRDLPAAWRNTPNSPARRHFDGANYLLVSGGVRWLKPQDVVGKNPAKNQVGFAVKTEAKP